MLQLVARAPCDFVATHGVETIDTSTPVKMVHTIEVGLRQLTTEKYLRLQTISLGW